MTNETKDRKPDMPPSPTDADSLIVSAEVSDESSKALKVPKESKKGSKLRHLKSFFEAIASKTAAAFKDKKKRRIAIPVTALALVLIGGVIWVSAGSGGAPVPVQSVSLVTGLDMGVKSRFTGVVEPQSTLKLNLDTTRVLDSRVVEVGTQVTEGQALFAYDTEELELALEQAELDIQRIEDSIATINEQITILLKERESTQDSALQLEYTTQVQSAETKVRQEEYQLKVKTQETDRIGRQIEASTVRSTVNGVVQSINEPMSSDPYFYYEDMDIPYIVILADGDFRVRGNISELNIEELTVGAPVKISSRIYVDDVWYGTVQGIDLENPVAGTSELVGAAQQDATVTTSKYPFYVTVENSSGLMLGQHVYIEPDVSTDGRPGIWLLEDYIIIEGGKGASEKDEDSDSDDESRNNENENDDQDEDFAEPDETRQPELSRGYVWAVSSRDRIEKREVELGDYDEASQSYEIVSGLDYDDEIAWPMAGVRAGKKVARGDLSELFSTEYEDPLSSETLNPAQETDDPEESDEPEESDSMNESPSPSLSPSASPSPSPSPSEIPGATYSDVPAYLYEEHVPATETDIGTADELGMV